MITPVEVDCVMCCGLCNNHVNDDSLLVPDDTALIRAYLDFV